MSTSTIYIMQWLLNVFYETFNNLKFHRNLEPVFCSIMPF